MNPDLRDRLTELETDILAMQAALQQALDDLAAVRALIESETNQTGMTVYFQRDPKWANVVMGAGVNTIGMVGCLITSVASMLTDAGKPFDPPTLNDWLRVNRGYLNGVQFVFNSIDKISAVHLAKVIECANEPAPMNELDAQIGANNFVIAKVNNGVPPDYHWVRYIGQGQMIDPWHGDIAPIVPRYKGKDAAQCILRAAIYVRGAS